MGMVSLAEEQLAQASNQFHTDCPRLHSRDIFRCHGRNRTRLEHDSALPCAKTCGSDHALYSSAPRQSMRSSSQQKLLKPRQKLSLSLILL